MGAEIYEGGPTGIYQGSVYIKQQISLVHWNQHLSQSLLVPRYSPVVLFQGIRELMCAIVH